nr:hypothetical protein [uncultured Gellertiella sp.]
MQLLEKDIAKGNIAPLQQSLLDGLGDLIGDAGVDMKAGNPPDDREMLLKASKDPSAQAPDLTALAEKTGFCNGSRRGE